MYWNMDLCLLKNGDLSAPQLSLDKFMTLLRAAVPGPEDSSDLDFCESSVLAQFDSEEEVELLPEAVEDASVAAFGFSDFGDISLGVRTDGVPYLAFSHWGDDLYPVYTFLYWDGANFRCYTPLYGNPLLNEIMDPASDGPFYISEDGVNVKEISFVDENDYLDFIEKHFFDGVDTIYKEGCLLDFTMAVQSVSSVPEEQFETSKSSLLELRQKYSDAKKKQEEYLSEVARKNQALHKRMKENKLSLQDGILFCTGMSPRYFIQLTKEPFFFELSKLDNETSVPLSQDDIQQFRDTYPHIYEFSFVDGKFVFTSGRTYGSLLKSSIMSRVKDIIQGSSQEFSIGFDYNVFLEIFKGDYKTFFNFVDRFEY